MAVEVRRRDRRDPVSLEALLQKEVKAERAERSRVRYGCAVQKKKGEDQYLMKTDCHRIPENASSTFSIFGNGETEYRTAWKEICEISRKEFTQVFQRLGVHIEEKGESFYNPFIRDVIQELSDKGLVEDSQGSRVIFIEGQAIPLILVKSDGGFNYASTDLCALCLYVYQFVQSFCAFIGGRDLLDIN